MPENAVSLLTKNYAIAHGRVIESAEGTDDGQFAKSMGTRIHSVAWQVWHIARWDDRYAEILVEKTPELAGRFGPPQQIWAAESLAKQWGLPIGHMGRRDTGTEMTTRPPTRFGYRIKWWSSTMPDASSLACRASCTTCLRPGSSRRSRTIPTTTPTPTTRCSIWIM